MESQSWRADMIRRQTAPRERVSMTEFTRGKEWRARLVECDILEVIDHNETVGWMVSVEGMNALNETIDSLERQIAELRGA